jgi:transposase
MDGVEEIAGQRKVHTFRGVEEKRRIVEETLQAGVSVSSVARAHGINANQVFQWRKVSDESRAQAAGCPAARLLQPPEGGCSSAGTIELAFDWGQLRIVGAVDREALRTVLGCLLT